MTIDYAAQARDAKHRISMQLPRVGVIELLSTFITTVCVTIAGTAFLLRDTRRTRPCWLEFVDHAVLVLSLISAGVTVYIFLRDELLNPNDSDAIELYEQQLRKNFNLPQDYSAVKEGDTDKALGCGYQAAAVRNQEAITRLTRYGRIQMLVLLLAMVGSTIAVWR